jgi:CheY-like chemotaxis protein
MVYSGDLKFFIVDDDAFSRNLYRQHLLNLGFRNNLMLSSGVECLNKLDLNPDIIFLDYGMAPLNGLEVLKQIKQTNPQIPVLMISANADDTVISEAYENGANAYIVKGEQDLDLIRRAVGNILRGIDGLAAYAVA